jgi:PAS domain S-box-containing protein
MTEPTYPPTAADDLESLRSRLTEAEETLRAIREGEVDALLIAHPSGERLYTLHTADAPYRAFVEQMQEGALLLGDLGQITYCNRHFAALTGIALEHLIGHSVEEFFTDDVPGSGLRQLLAAGSGTLRTQLRQGTARAREVHVSLATVSLDDQPQRTLLVTDMSTIARMQRESREKDEFLAMLAHELRNPLGAIGGAAQVLGLCDLREPHAIRAHAVIQRQVVHMARLMDDLLDVGRVVTGKIDLERRAVDLAQCVRGCVTAATAGQYGQRTIELETQSVWVDGDPVRLEQIASNLVSNALRFTEEHQVVRVSVGEESDSAVLRVADDGVGIEPQILPRIFDLFVQADRSRDRAKGGLGIGLTLVKRLVELHGGTVDAASPGPGQGSTFTVRLPRIAAEVLSPPGERSGRTTARLSILLVDDNADARAMCALMLEADGHYVFQSADGPSALQVFRRIQPQVAVIDIGLPGMDGYDVARRLRAEPQGRDVKLIALTGYGFPEDRERSRAEGFDSHLVKPVEPDELRRHLATDPA